MRQKHQPITGTPAKSGRNGIAAALASACFRQRKIRPKIGRGSYSRKRLSSPATQA